MRKTRLLLVDDHAVLRMGLRYVLSDCADLEIVAEAGSVKETFDALAATTLDLVLLDISLPDGSGLEVLKVIKREHPALRVVILTNHAESEFAAYALSEGADAYVPKTKAPELLVETIRRAVNSAGFSNDS
jgi:two-component system, NarL family, invasion response regulator UvrY